MGWEGLKSRERTMPPPVGVWIQMERTSLCWRAECAPVLGGWHFQNPTVLRLGTLGSGTSGSLAFFLGCDLFPPGPCPPLGSHVQQGG